MNDLTEQLIDALRVLTDHADAASTEGRFADGMGSELTALEDAREAIAAYEAQRVATITMRD